MGLVKSRIKSEDGIEDTHKVVESGDNGGNLDDIEQLSTQVNICEQYASLDSRKSTLDLDLTIVNIPDDDMVENWSEFLEKCFTQTTEENMRLKLIKYVLRFLRESDRWLHLVSILMKSKAHHEYRIKSNVLETSINIDLPIVDLPRTEYGKPYIEDIRSLESSLQIPAPLLSVSHHERQVILARLNDPMKIPNKIRMGADLVVIDIHPMQGVADFLSCFNSSFSSKEWKSIQYAHMVGGEAAAMKEFYTRWALKEAYVKALGIGLGLDLQSFDMEVFNVNNQAFDVCRASKEYSTHRIKVSHQKIKGREKDEYWDIILFLLKNQSSSKDSIICVCAGPVEYKSSPPCFRALKTRRVSVETLIRWHTYDNFIFSDDYS